MKFPGVEDIFFFLILKQTKQNKKTGCNRHGHEVHILISTCSDYFPISDLIASGYCHLVCLRIELTQSILFKGIR